MIKITTYGQYFTVESPNLSFILFKLHEFNKNLTTLRMDNDYKNKKVVFVKDKEFFVCEEAREGYNVNDRLRYPITLLDEFMKNLDELKLEDEIKLTHVSPIEGRDIEIESTDTRPYRYKQKEFIDTISKTDKNNILIGLETGYGKDVRYGTKVHTKDNKVDIETLKIGDKIYSPNGKLVRVTGVYPQGLKPQINLFMEDDRITTSGREHLWEVYIKNKYKEVLTTEKITEYLDNGVKITIRPTKPICGKKIRNIIDPYVLGVVLATGEIKNNSIIIYSVNYYIKEAIYRYATIYKHIIKYDYIKTIVKLSTSDIADIKKYIKDFTIEDLLRYYLDGSYNQIKDILTGVIDSIGSIRGKSFYVNINNFTIMNLLKELIYKIGGICKVSRKHNTYVLKIKLQNISEYTFFNRNISHYVKKNNIPDMFRINIVDYSYAGVHPSICISVDDEDKLFLIDDYIATHNTRIIIDSLAKIKKAFAIVILPRYIDKWINDITSGCNIKKEEILVMQGVNNFINLIHNNSSILSNYKCYIISLTTISVYINYYLSGKLLMYGNKTPDDIFKELDVGVIVNDETHQEFFNVYRMLLFANVKLFIGVTATLKSKNRRISRVYKALFPEDENRRLIDLESIEPYVNVIAISYRFRYPKKIRYKNNFGYSQDKLEKSIIKNNITLNNYMDMIKFIADIFFIKKMVKGDKLLIFIYRVELCSLVRDYLRTYYKDLIINKYTREDEYNTILESDIIVSTILSSGTALDIPNLTVVINTINVDSVQANDQTKGRLREIKNKEVTYIFTWSLDIKAHRRYYYNRIKLFNNKSKNIKTISYKKYI